MSGKEARLVYTTDPVEAKQLRDSNTMPVATDQPHERQTIRVAIDRKRRKGKTVTVASGFALTKDSLDSIAKQLKSRCAAGGKQGADEIEIQGDHVETVAIVLSSLGFRIKRT